jgi:hypothetical protein
MPQWVEKLRDYTFGAVGGFLSGAVANTFIHSLALQLVGYQEGWYRQFAPFFVIPVLVLLVYISGLAASASRWRFLAAAVLITPVFIIYIVTRFYVPVSERHAWIEFTALWTMIGQIAGIFLVGSWVLFWLTYDRMKFANMPSERRRRIKASGKADAASKRSEV